MMRTVIPTAYPCSIQLEDRGNPTTVHSSVRSCRNGPLPCAQSPHLGRRCARSQLKEGCPMLRAYPFVVLLAAFIIATADAKTVQQELLATRPAYAALRPAQREAVQSW